MAHIILEVCAFNIQSCIVAEKAGAARVELCDSPVEGGSTPSYGTIKRTREKVSIELYPIVRPRAGHYWFDEDEFAIMQKDILVCKELGCDGVSTGISLQSGEIDTDRLKRLVDLAYPMGVTCHRVFDRTPDPFKALEQLIDCGCERVLTSGQKSAAPDAADVLAKLVQQANGRIIVMPGAGIRSSNIGELIKTSGATEYHTSARVIVPDPVKHENPAVLDSGHVYIASEEELVKILAVAKSIG